MDTYAAAYAAAQAAHAHHKAYMEWAFPPAPPTPPPQSQPPGQRTTPEPVPQPRAQPPQPQRRPGMGATGPVRARRPDAHADAAYAVLGLEPGASRADVRKAYFSLARHTHPDKGGDVAAFRRVTAAYEHLINAHMMGGWLSNAHGTRDKVAAWLINKSRQWTAAHPHHGMTPRDVVDNLHDPEEDPDMTQVHELFKHAYGHAASQPQQLRFFHAMVRTHPWHTEGFDQAGGWIELDDDEKELVNGYKHATGLTWKQLHDIGQSGVLPTQDGSTRLPSDSTREADKTPAQRYVKMVRVLHNKRAAEAEKHGTSWKPHLVGVTRDHVNEYVAEQMKEEEGGGFWTGEAAMDSDEMKAQKDRSSRFNDQDRKAIMATLTGLPKENHYGAWMYKHAGESPPTQPGLDTPAHTHLNWKAVKQSKADGDDPVRPAWPGIPMADINERDNASHWMAPSKIKARGSGLQAGGAVDGAVTRDTTRGQLRHLAPAGTVITAISDIVNKPTIQAVLGPTKAAILLYVTQMDPVAHVESGHWTVCMQHADGSIETFDPYGMRPDAELRFVCAACKAAANERHAVLTPLLMASGQRLVYNKADLQSHSPRVSTCGRHCIVRLWHRDMPIDAYVRWLRGAAAAAGMTTDEYVTSVTLHHK